MLTQDKDLRTGTPYWLGLPHPRIRRERLRGDLRTEVLIIGAGITGAMAAEELTAAGFQVTLIDRRPPMMGATAATTALLQYEIDTPLTKLQKQIGADKAMRAWRRSKLALESLNAKLTALQIDCAQERCATLYLNGDVLDAEGLKQEADARRHIGLPTEYLTRSQVAETGLRKNAALRSQGSMRANPLALAAGLLKHAQARGARIYSPVTAEKLSPHARGVTVLTQGGPVIEASHVIYACGYEVPKAVLGKHEIHSTYAFATKPQRGKLWKGEALIWEASDPYLYVRSTPEGRVICGGGDEAFADEETRDALLARKVKALQSKLGKLVPSLDTTAEYAWCGSFGVTQTGLPTIGAVPGQGHCSAILAFGGNGITFARIAAEVVTAQLKGKPDPDADLFAF